MKDTKDVNEEIKKWNKEWDRFVQYMEEKDMPKEIEEIKRMLYGIEGYHKNANVIMDSINMFRETGGKAKLYIHPNGVHDCTIELTKRDVERCVNDIFKEYNNQIILIKESICDILESMLISYI